MTQRRAQKGGETGVNGEFYEGGKFIANTDRAKGSPKPQGKLRKYLAEPGKLVEAPALDPGEYAGAILPMLAGIELYDASAKTFRLNPDIAPGYYGTHQERQESIDRYNGGARWWVRETATRQATGRYLDLAGNEWNAK